MQKITIISNDDLYKALGQAVEFLPGCGLYLAPSLNADIIKDSACIIADGARLGDIQELSGAKFIALANADDVLEQSDIAVIRKPYRVRDVVEMLRSVMAQPEASGESVEIGNFVFDIAARTLTKGEVKITLTEKEADLVMLLFSSEGEVSHEEILREVWGYEADIDTHTAQTHIYRIRQKLGKDDDFIGSGEGGYFIKIQ